MKGALQEAKCKFTTKEVDCGQLAVGIDSERVVTVKNIGKSPAIVFVDNFPEGTGITCKPEKARIPIGQVQEFTVTVKPPMPRIYQDIGMTLAVRGGKLLRIPITAESVVPKVTLEQENFDFERVVIGNTIRMPVSLTNEGTIPASLTLDLSKYSDFSQ